VPPNGGRNEAPPDKPPPRLHRTAARAEIVPAGPAVCCKRLLGQLAHTALANAAPGLIAIIAAAAGPGSTYPVARRGVPNPIGHTVPENQIASISPTAAVDPMLGQST
jgi:hypothetical protein